MLHAYLDGSGTHSGSPVVSISGFVGSESAWMGFDLAWNQVLDDPRWPTRLSEFHMVDCAHGGHEYLEGRWSFAERLSLYGRLVEVKGAFELQPISASALTHCFEQIPPDDLSLLRREENRLGTPLDVVFHMIVQQILSQVRDSEEGVGIVFDQESKDTERYFADFCHHYRAEYHLGDLFAGYGFADSKESSPLQAADLLAYGTHHLSQERFLGASYKPPDFPVTNALWTMLLSFAQSPSTSPVGKLIDLGSLQDLVEKVRNKETLPGKGA